VIEKEQVTMYGREESLRPIYVDDVSDDVNGSREALMLVARNYARLSSQRLRPEDVYDELCLDTFQREGVARTLLATAYDPVSGRFETLGTARFIFGRTTESGSNALPFDFMELVEPSDGWDCFRFDGFTPASAAEVGRFALSPVCTKGRARSAGLHLEVTRAFLQHIFSAMEHSRLNQLWCLMPGYVTRLIESAGFPTSAAPSLKLREEGNSELFEKYDRYWRHCSPRLYRIYESSDSVVATPGFDSPESRRLRQSA
jgi:hypothetical protein